MANNPNPNPNSDLNPSLLPEIGPDGLPRENSVIAYTEKVIEEEQLQLRKYIQENYSKIRDVERELANLTMEMKLTSGPKKAALEHMRKKIEISTERIRVAKIKEEEARKAWEAASKTVQDEEATKQKLCEDLNCLVQESSNIQFARLEELKRRIGALNPSRSSSSARPDGNPLGPTENNGIPNASPVQSTSGSTAGSSNPSTNRGNEGTNPLTNGQSQRDNEGKGKKKTMIQGRGRGIGAIPKGRGSGSGSPGWTGAGFDVDR